MARYPKKGSGVGNKEGSIRPKFNAYWSQDDIGEYMTWLKENYKSKPELAKFVGDHLFGKALQPIGNDDGQPLIIQFTDAFTAQKARGNN